LRIDTLQMNVYRHQIATFLATALMACSLAGCGTINEKLTAGGVGDYIPQWAGGLPADAPPRPGTAKYDEMMKERERLRMMPASERPGASQAGDSSSAQTSSGQPSSSGLAPVH
jgi:hypothetical protein